MVQSGNEFAGRRVVADNHPRLGWLLLPLAIASFLVGCSDDGPIRPQAPGPTTTPAPSPTTSTQLAVPSDFEGLEPAQMCADRDCGASIEVQASSQTKLIREGDQITIDVTTTNHGDGVDFLLSPAGQIDYSGDDLLIISSTCEGSHALRSGDSVSCSITAKVDRIHSVGSGAVTPREVYIAATARFYYYSETWGRYEEGSVTAGGDGASSTVHLDLDNSSVR